MDKLYKELKKLKKVLEALIEIALAAGTLISIIKMIVDSLR